MLTFRLAPDRILPLALPRASRGLLFWGLVTEGGLAALAWWLSWVWDVPLWQSLKPPPTAAALAATLIRGAGATVPLVVVLLCLLRSTHRWSVDLRQVLRERVIPVFQPLPLWQLAVVAAAAGWGEELLFRGFLQVWLSRYLPPAAALAVAGILFGAAHPITWGYAIGASLCGIYLGWLFLASHDLWTPVLAHGLYDFAALWLLTRMRFPAEQGPRLDPGEAESDEPTPK